MHALVLQDGLILSFEEEGICIAHHLVTLAAGTAASKIGGSHRCPPGSSPCRAALPSSYPGKRSQDQLGSLARNYAGAGLSAERGGAKGAAPADAAAPARMGWQWHNGRERR
jgi:hypothetical protein